ncbi:MAG: STAS domain-containing protein [Actinomycetota bacterium]
MAAPDQSRTTRVPAHPPPSEPSTIVLVIKSPLDRVDITRLSERVRTLLQESDADLVICDVGGLVDPDAGSVDALARLQLTARRLGREVRLHQACGELQELLALMGLSEVLPPCAELPLEPRWQAEEREQAPGVQEEGDPADPAG